LKSHTLLLASLLIVGSVGLVMTIAWLAVQWTLDPNSATWLTRMLPGWSKIDVDNPYAPKTLPEIRGAIDAQGLIPGEVIILETDDPSETTRAKAPPDLLLPVLAQRQYCELSNCQEIVELRVYQSESRALRYSKQGNLYYLVSQLAVTGPAESYAISPLSNTNAAPPGSNQSLPLSVLEPFEQGTPQGGIWLNLRGMQMQGSTQISYGQVLHYNRDRAHLAMMAQWTSSIAKSPSWQQLTGNDTPELIVDRTIGLEPAFEVYQLQPRDFYLHPIQLTPISIAEPAIDSRTYKNALYLARNGLWSPALDILRTLKRELGRKWTPAAQTQLDFVQLHARFTQTQANADWASPGETVRAAIIDGRWEEALQVFEASPENRLAITSILAADNGRLWKRVNAKLRISVADESVMAWGALILAAQEDKKRSLKWLNEEFGYTPEPNGRIAKVLAQLEAARLP
jgi:hypothetical protein